VSELAQQQVQRPHADADWLTQRERGAIFGMRVVFWIATALGRRVARQFVRVIALWYFLWDRTARAASKQFLSRIHGRAATWSEVYGHILRFSRVTIDRVFLLLDRHEGLTINRTGNHYLDALTRERRGAVLLGAHMGSFEALRADAEDISLRLNIVGHFENARMINALLSKLNKDAEARVVHVGQDPVGFAMTVSERIQSGELVAILADRVGLNDKQIEVPFLGQTARFPTGPFLLASLLKCPVYLVFGLYFEPNRYELFCEPFAERIELPRAQRAAALQAVVQRYAERVEHYARMAPDNWFNFFDFWKNGSA
jgi:predicted LPLAT superfamily acyltransferase